MKECVHEKRDEKKIFSLCVRLKGKFALISKREETYAE
jgi:hypothetical protein